MRDKKVDIENQKYGKYLHVLHVSIIIIIVAKSNFYVFTKSNFNVFARSNFFLILDYFLSLQVGTLTPIPNHLIQAILLPISIPTKLCKMTLRLLYKCTAIIYKSASIEVLSVYLPSNLLVNPAITEKAISSLGI